MRTAALILLAALHGGPAAARSLYESSTIVTGMDARSRPDGFRRALAQVLAKVAARPALETDERLTGLDPGSLLRGFAYLDRMSDIPRHDEQGSRDRPFDLIVQFDPAGIDRVLRAWGEAPWPEPRPPLVVRIEIRPRRGTPTMLRADTDADEPHRAALLAAGERYGADLLLPAAADGRDPPPDAPVLSGTLRWSDADAGWVGEWSIRDRRWSISGVSFDAAYRDAVGGALDVVKPARP